MTAEKGHVANRAFIGQDGTLDLNGTAIDTLEVTGATTHGGVVTHQHVLADADADYYGVPHGSIWRTHAATSGTLYSWTDILQPDDTLADNTINLVQYQPTLLNQWPAKAGVSNDGFSFGRFEAGHFGDVTHVDTTVFGGFTWGAANDDGTHPVVQLFCIGSGGTFRLNIDGDDGSANFNCPVTATGFTAAVKPVVTGSRGGNAALASLLTALASLGLITDSTS